MIKVKTQQINAYLNNKKQTNIYIYKRKKLEVTSGSTKKTSICQLLPRPVFQSFIYNTYVVYMTAS